MKALDKTVDYDLRDLNDEQTELLFEQIRKQSVHKFDYKRSHETNFAGFELDNNWYTANCPRGLKVKNLVNALELFQEDKINGFDLDYVVLDECKFKQGDKVLVRDFEDEDWSKGVYVVEYNGNHYVESYDDYELIYYKFIKPYDPQKKWYKSISPKNRITYDLMDTTEKLGLTESGFVVLEITDKEFINHLENN